jgi:hypothetical protein
MNLEKLADDIQTYFGLGCRNVTKLYVPEEYDFEPYLRRLINMLIMKIFISTSTITTTS